LTTAARALVARAPAQAAFDPDDWQRLERLRALA
jgi:hypothetical protein